MTAGITTASLGEPDWEKALMQHAEYARILGSLGLSVSTLEGDEAFPDSTFVEDTAVVTDRIAVVSNPGAASRNAEAASMAAELARRFGTIERIVAPGTLDGGDVMMVDSHFYIGLSGRTNEEGAKQLIDILARHGYSGEAVGVGSVLHLKTGVNYLANGVMIGIPEMLERAEYSRFKKVAAPREESYAANSLMINGTVIVPTGFPRVRDAIEKAGFPTVECDVSEFRKLDGGLSCLSLRY
jgi:dimethylargininase